MSKRTKRSVCPLACTLDLLGDKWSLLVIRDMLCGKSHFHEFMASPERIASNILADRLDRLVKHGLVQASPSPDRAGAQTYQLTQGGRDLEPILHAVKDWGLAHIKGTMARLQTVGRGGAT